MASDNRHKIYKVECNSRLMLTNIEQKDLSKIKVSIEEVKQEKQGH